MIRCVYATDFCDNKDGLLLGLSSNAKSDWFPYERLKNPICAIATINFCAAQNRLSGQAEFQPSLNHPT
jgi:hypothetical protein